MVSLKVLTSAKLEVFEADYSLICYCNKGLFVLLHSDYILEQAIGGVGEWELRQLYHENGADLSSVYSLLLSRVLAAGQVCLDPVFGHFYCFLVFPFQNSILCVSKSSCFDSRREKISQTILNLLFFIHHSPDKFF